MSLISTDVYGSGALSEAESKAVTTAINTSKLGFDVYLEFFKVWDKQVFASTSVAQKRNMSAVASLMDSYDMDIPLDPNAPGSFSLPGYSAMYHGYISSGSASLEDAYRAAVDVETLCIDEISGLLRDPHVSTPAVRRLLNKLLSTSQENLDRFTKLLSQ
ncbi:DUF2202 domain-containing protein [Limihaloglobus sulfuriphilus]|nr:DUF2202 domain-containing protein [Limihaloglobus sulfuriphilus]